MTKLLALAFAVAPVACAAALDLSSFALRGWSSDKKTGTTTTMVQLQAECEDGFEAGYERIGDYWEDSGSNCDDVWTLEDDAADIKEEDYPDSSNWRTQSFNDCARTGVDEAVSDIEKACLEDDSSQCVDLGVAAAEQVVMKNWCTPGSHTYGADTSPDYKAECKDAAVSICEGNIYAVAQRWCPNKNVPTSSLNDLKDECEDQVDMMVPGASFLSS